MPGEPFLRITGLSKSYAAGPVLDDLSLTLEQGRILAIVGPSGSGKTTLARCLARFEPHDAGEIRIDGRDYRELPRTCAQLIFQQPAASLNPRLSAFEIVSEPLVIQGVGTRAERRKMAAEAMRAVGLDPAAMDKGAMEFSGGERQRLAIARALVVDPKLLVLDESFTGLDLSIQAQIGNLLLDLRANRGLTCILITHDLTTVARLADEIAVIDRGRIVRQGSPEAIQSGVAPAILSPVMTSGATRPRALLRVLHSIGLLLAVSLLSFVFADLVPGDFYSALRTDPRLSADTIAGLRARAGLNRPLPVRYGEWLVSCMHGDFGYSLAYNGPVAPLLWPRAGATLLLAGIATLLSWAIALPLGVWNAAARGSWMDRAARFLLTCLLAVPDLLLAIALLILAVETGWFPVGGTASRGFSSMTPWQQVRDYGWHLALPVLVLVLGMLPMLVRHVRAAMLEQMDAPFAVNARALGIPRRRLLFHHILPAAANPLLALFGFSLGTMLSAGLLVEVILSWPGLGPFFLEAVLSRDFGVVLAVVLLSTTFLVLGNLFADVLLYRLDPRIRRAG
jgi:peptide/nickel transport system permease protein